MHLNLIFIKKVRKNQKKKIENKTFSKHSQKSENNTPSPKKIIFAFKNNSFNNNSELNKSVKNGSNNNSSIEEESESSSVSNKSSKSGKKVNNENNTNIENKKILNSNINKKNFILSQKNNIIDIFSKNEKSRMKKFSDNIRFSKVNDLLNHNKDEKQKRKFSKQVYSFPVNQNFKSIKNISNDIKIKNNRTSKYSINNQKNFNFFRKRSRSYKTKKIDNKLSKKIEEYRSNFFKIEKDSKNLSYSYNDGIHNLNFDKNGKINKRKNKRYYTGHFNQKGNKNKLSIQNELNEKKTGIVGNTESNIYAIKKYKTKISEKKPTFFNIKTNSYTFEDKENRLSRIPNIAPKRSGSSFSGYNLHNPMRSKISNFYFNNEFGKDEDKLYIMIKNFEKSVKERLRIEEKKSNNNYKMNMNNMYYNNMNSNINLNNLLLKNNINTVGEVELIPRKYIFRCKKVIYPEIESEKIKERERLLFGKNKFNY